MASNLKILLLDGSQRLMELLGTALTDHDDFQVVGAVRNREAAADILARKRPDVVVMDVAAAGALDLVRDVQEFNADHPHEPETGVVLIAGREHRDQDITIGALEAGAFDFITRPDQGGPEAVSVALERQLAVKLRHFSSKRIFSSMAVPDRARAASSQPTPQPSGEGFTPPASGLKAVLIGVSTGGPRVLAGLLPELCRVVRAPIFIVQHMPTGFTGSLAASLDAKCGHRVVEAVDNSPVSEGVVYIAPGGVHMLLRRDSRSQAVVSLRNDPPEDGCRPSVNMLFRSGAAVFGGDVAAVVLTGMGSDGARALPELKKAGACILAQDKATSVVWGMPGSAVATGCVDKVLPCEEIPGAISVLARKA
jgi:two-component system, chemotaxis family, protein-glutamate methylesterase/glutaminase